MKKILVVTTRPLESNTSSTIMKVSTIEALLNEGANITLITTYNENFSEPVLGLLSKITTIRMSPGFLYKKGIQSQKRSNISNTIKRFLRKIYYKFVIYDPLKNSIKHIGEIKDKLEDFYDIVLSISDPKSSHLLAMLLLEKNFIKYRKYIQIWGDPMYLDITNKTLLPRWIIKDEESKIISKADQIYYVSPLTLIEEQKLFPQFAYKMDVLIPLCKEKKLYHEVTEIKKLGYFGDFYSGIRNIKPLYNAIRNSDYELTICGNSNLNLKQTKNIKIYERMAYEDAKQYESKVDMLVHISNCKGTQIPGKIYQYFGTNKAILFILDGESAKIKEFFEPLNRVLFANNNEDDILKKLNDYNKNQYGITNRILTEFDTEYYKRKIIDQ